MALIQSTRWRLPLARLFAPLAERLSPWLPDYFPIAWKLGLAISLLMISSMLTLGSLLNTEQLERLASQTHRFGHTLAAQLADAAREPLLAGDEFGLRVMLGNLMQNASLSGAALFDHRGQRLSGNGRVPAELPMNQTTVVHWQQLQEPLSTYLAAIEVDGLSAGYAAITLSRNALDAARQQAHRTLLRVTALVTVASVLFAFLLSRLLARPLRHLLATTRALHRGEWPAAGTRRSDEIGQLLTAYQTMASGLLEKRQVEQVLSRFVSPAVAKRMIADLRQVELGGREVTATVIFADIVGFTRLSETLQPDAVAELLNAYFDAIANAARCYRGTIDKYIGDGAMLVFGVPEPDDEHAFHALCCAVMIQRLTVALNLRRTAQGKPTVSFRIGVHSGRMLAGNLGADDRMEYTVVGDAVNLASRLCNAASSGDILASESLASGANICSRLRAEPAGALAVRGRTQPVNTTRITDVHPDAARLMARRVDDYLLGLARRNPPTQRLTAGLDRRP